MPDPSASSIRAALGLQVLAADVHHRLLFDQVTHLPTRLDELGDLRQALGVERVRRVEMLQRRLVHVHQRHAFQLQPVRRQRVGRLFAHPRHEGGALFMDLLQRQLGGDSDLLNQVKIVAALAAGAY